MQREEKYICRALWSILLHVALLCGVMVAAPQGAAAINVAEISVDSTQRAVERQLRREERSTRRYSKKVWTTVLGGPSYTPEASVGAAAALLMSFKIDDADSVAMRSFLPIGVNLSINGTYVVAGSGALFFNENRFRIYSDYGFRNEPTNFYGVGFSEIDATQQGVVTTAYVKRSLNFANRFLWEVKPSLFVGPVMDINYSYSYDMAEQMAQNSYVASFRAKYTNIGLGGIVQYDSRDDIATPYSGIMASALFKSFGRYFGGSYTYHTLDFEYRQYAQLFRRATLAWTSRAMMSYGDTPFTELPTWGSPNNMRGFYIGQYRDRSAGYSMVEFRHMLGSVEAVERGSFISKLGYVLWTGAGSLGDNPAQWTQWKYSVGGGLRVQIQPRKNFRLDVGKGIGQQGVLVYFNMTEAF